MLCATLFALFTAEQQVLQLFRTRLNEKTSSKPILLAAVFWIAQILSGHLSVSASTQQRKKFG